MTQGETLTTGMVGQEVKLEFTEDWEAFGKTVVFSAGEVSRDVAAFADVVGIPHEVLAEAGHHLYVGVYGVAADGRVIPTIRAQGPCIRSGADPAGDEGLEPSLPVWAQIGQEVDRLQADMAEKLPKPQGSSAVGQILAVGEVDVYGTVWDVRPIDLPVGGKVLGCVKNGGDVVIAPDGTMTVPGLETGAGTFSMERSADTRDGSLRILFVGDDLMAPDEFREYVAVSLDGTQNCIGQSGASVTAGAGLVQNCPEAEETDIVIVALGTNDFLTGAPLGSADDLSADGTFYGAAEKTLTLLESACPNARIFWILPFKNARWTAANSAGHTMTDYLTALKILGQMHRRVRMVDLFDRWYLDYDNDHIRSAFFTDDVHISANAHRCLAADVADRIRW